jgi:hypothetical protein
MIDPKAPPMQHHDALLFPDGKRVLVNLLSEGQYAHVLQLPVARLEETADVRAEKALAPATIRKLRHSGEVAKALLIVGEEL